MSSGEDQSPTEGTSAAPNEGAATPEGPQVAPDAAEPDAHQHDPAEASGDAGGEVAEDEDATAPEGGDDSGASADVDPVPLAVAPDPLAELQAKYDEAQARLRTVSKAYRDLQSEMAAFRERMEARSKFESERQAFDQARRFFDPVMNLKRSLHQPSVDIETLRGGLEMVQRQFMEAMEKLGLEEVPGEGANFDPHLHEALAVSPVADAAQDGKVLMVHTSGFMVKGKVLQAAQVVIGKFEPVAGEG
jgi:molecular chaperone GrpE